MAGYNFKLEKLLNYKEKIEDIKKAEFAETSHKLNLEEERLLYFNNYKENLLKRKKASNVASVSQYKLYSNYIYDISKIIENQKKVVEGTKKELNKVQEELIVAMQERKSFEKLKELKYEEYLSDIKKKEDNMIDGIVTFRTNTQK